MDKVSKQEVETLSALFSESPVDCYTKRKEREHRREQHKTYRKYKTGLYSRSKYV